jgi:hypothetical protein
MSVNRLAFRVASDGLLITAAGAAVRLDSTVPGRRMVEPRRRRHPDERRGTRDEDTVTLHTPDDEDEVEAPDPVEALRRGGFRRPA